MKKEKWYIWKCIKEKEIKENVLNIKSYILKHH